MQNLRNARDPLSHSLSFHRIPFLPRPRHLQVRTVGEGPALTHLRRRPVSETMFWGRHCVCHTSSHFIISSPNQPRAQKETKTEIRKLRLVLSCALPKVIQQVKGGRGWVGHSPATACKPRPSPRILPLSAARAGLFTCRGPGLSHACLRKHLWNRQASRQPSDMVNDLSVNRGARIF